jgi:hypothetical protein
MRGLWRSIFKLFGFLLLGKRLLFNLLAIVNGLGDFDIAILPQLLFSCHLQQLSVLLVHLLGHVLGLLSIDAFIVACL